MVTKALEGIAAGRPASCALCAQTLNWTAASQAAVVLAASTLSSRLQSRPTSSRSQSLKVMGVQPWQ